MRDDFSIILDEAFNVVAGLTLQGSLVLGMAALLAVSLRRRSAAARHCVWLGAVAALLALPIGWTFWPRQNLLPADVYRPSGTTNENAARPAGSAQGASLNEDHRRRPDVQGETPAHPPAEESVSLAEQASLGIELLEGPGLLEASSEEHLPYRFWSHVAVVVWATGVILLLARLAGGALRARKLLRQARPAEADVQSIATRICRHLCARSTPRILVSERHMSPATAGWFRPKILVPEELVGRLLAGLLEPLILHELLHVMRRDALVHGLALLARSLFWPNPLAWSVVRALAREREILADAGVVGCLGRRADDAEGLLCVLEALQRPSPAQALFPGVSLGGQRSLRDRLEMVITGGGRSWEELSQCGRIAITTVMAGVLFLAPC